MVIEIKGRMLRFDNSTWHSWVKNVNWDNLNGTSNRAAVYAALESYAYDNRLPYPDWKEAGEFCESLNEEELKKVIAAFESMDDYKKYLEKIKEEVKKLTPAETKKKRLKASPKT